MLRLFKPRVHQKAIGSIALFYRYKIRTFQWTSQWTFQWTLSFIIYFYNIIIAFKKIYRFKNSSIFKSDGNEKLVQTANLGRSELNTN